MIIGVIPIHQTRKSHPSGRLVVCHIAWFPSSRGWYWMTNMLTDVLLGKAGWVNVAMYTHAWIHTSTTKKKLCLDCPCLTGHPRLASNFCRCRPALGSGLDATPLQYQFRASFATTWPRAIQLRDRWILAPYLWRHAAGMGWVFHHQKPPYIKHLTRNHGLMSALDL